MKKKLLLPTLIVFFATTCDSPSEYVEIYGCTITEACNFNPEANIYDGSCGFINEDSVCGEVVGCMDEIACNYNEDATVGQGCFYTKSISIVTEQSIAGVQLTLTHGEDFSIQLTEFALIAEYNTSENTTNIEIINPETEQLFTCIGEYEITQVSVVNISGVVLNITEFTIVEDCI